MPPESPTASRASPTARQGALLCGVLALLSLPVLWAPGVGAAMDVLGRVIDPAQPYFSTADLALLYLRMPLSVLGAVAR